MTCGSPSQIWKPRFASASSEYIFVVAQKFDGLQISQLKESSATLDATLKQVEVEKQDTLLRAEAAEKEHAAAKSEVRLMQIS